MHLPDPIIQSFIEFQALLSAPSYRKMVLLVCGTLLAHRRRAVTAALKMLGMADEPNWSKYHNLLNHAKWSGLEACPGYITHPPQFLTTMSSIETSAPAPTPVNFARSDKGHIATVNAFTVFNY